MDLKELCAMEDPQSIDEALWQYRQWIERYNELSRIECTSWGYIEQGFQVVGRAVVELSQSTVEIYEPPRYDDEPSTLREHGYRKRPIPPDIRWDIWERDNFTCLNCGSRRDLSVDHIVAESRGGEATRENLQTLCRPCNSRKGSRA